MNRMSILRPERTSIRILQHGFTLVELIVVISIISLLLAILLPMLAKTRESAQNAVCMSNERQMVTGTLLYVNDHRSEFPPGHDFSKFPWFQPENHWAGILLPYISDRHVYQCPTQLVSFPANTYVANGGFWMFYDARKNVSPTKLENIRSAERLVMFFEHVRDWTGQFGFPSLPAEDALLMSDYQAGFAYSYSAPNTRLTGGRHFRTSGGSGQDPYGSDNLAFVDGHVRTGVSMQHLVETGADGWWLGGPFESAPTYPLVGALDPGDRPNGVYDFWTVPQW